jgi:hypothetical protein
MSSKRYICLFTQQIHTDWFVAFDVERKYRAFGKTAEAAKRHYCERHRVTEKPPTLH